MKLALLQMTVLERNKAANVARGLRLLEEAAKGHDIMVMPEIWTTGYSLGHLDTEAEEENGPLIRDICSIAEKSGCAIVAGSIPVRRGGKTYNTSIAIDKSGRIVNIYDKAHLFVPFGEDKRFTRGNNFNVFNLEGMCCGSTVCYDLRFPELYRRLALNGAEVVFCPAEWPESRGEQWRVLLQARSLESQVFMVGVNCSGEFKGEVFFGHSMVVGPFGDILAEAGLKEEVVSCTIDLADIGTARTKINALADVREELFRR